MSIEKLAELKALCLKLASEHKKGSTETLEIAKKYFEWLLDKA